MGAYLILDGPAVGAVALGLVVALTGRGELRIAAGALMMLLGVAGFVLNRLWDARGCWDSSCEFYDPAARTLWWMGIAAVAYGLVSWVRRP